MSTKKQSVKPSSALAAVFAYPPENDIYGRDNQAQDINPEDLSTKKATNELNDNPEEIDLCNNYDGIYLDMPGADLYDADEKIAEEDEESKYFSIAGENHMELEEDHYD